MQGGVWESWPGDDDGLCQEGIREVTRDLEVARDPGWEAHDWLDR